MVTVERAGRRFRVPPRCSGACQAKDMACLCVKRLWAVQLLPRDATSTPLGNSWAAAMEILPDIQDKLPLCPTLLGLWTCHWQIAAIGLREKLNPMPSANCLNQLGFSPGHCSAWFHARGGGLTAVWNIGARQDYLLRLAIDPFSQPAESPGVAYIISCHSEGLQRYAGLIWF